MIQNLFVCQQPIFQDYTNNLGVLHITNNITLQIK